MEVTEKFNVRERTGKLDIIGDKYGLLALEVGEGFYASNFKTKNNVVSIIHYYNTKKKGAEGKHFSCKKQDDGTYLIWRDK